MHRKRPLFILLLAILLSLGSLIWLTPRVLVHAAGNTYYVATNGNDSNVGTLAAPFLTIQKAANVARAGDTVLVRAGTYRETVIPANWGSSGAPITFAPYTGESVTISGADPVTGWSVSSGNIYAATGVTGFTSSIDQAAQVFVDGQMVNEARWPNNPASTFTTISYPNTATMQQIVSDNGGTTTRTITFADSNLTQPDGFWNGAKIWMQPALQYQAVTGTVTAYTQGKITFTYNYGSADSAAPAAGSKYYLFGTRNALDAPGEWYRDPATNTLYLWTPDGSNPSSHTVEIKRRDYAFDLSADSTSPRAYYTIQGFNIFAATITTDNASGDGTGNVRQGSVAGSNHVIIDGIHARYLSHFTDLSAFVYSQWENNTGIILSGSDQVLQNSILEYSAGNGVTVLGLRNKVLNNIIHDVDYMATEASAINTGFNNTTSEDFEIANNTAYTSGKDLILGRSLQNSDPNNPVTRIHNNDLSNGDLQTADTGIIYVWANSTSPRNSNGVRIDHNLVHDAYDKVAGGGIYLDGQSNHFVVDHNVIWNVLTGIVDGSENNLIYNNTVMDNGSSIVSNGQDNLGTILRNNIFGGRISQVATATLSNNLTRNVNPLLTDRSNANFTPRSDSPARNAGVVLSPYTDGYLESAPDIGAYEYDPSHPGQPNWTAGSSLALPTAAAPTGLQGVVGTNSIVLFWHNNTTTANHIYVERNDGGNLWNTLAVLPGNATSYADTSLLGGKYLYRVRADNSPYSPLLAIGAGRSALALIYASSFDSYGGGDGLINVFGPVGGFDHGNWLKYNSVSFPAGLSTFTVNFQSYQACNNKCHFEVWQDALPTYAGGPGGGFKIADVAINYTAADFTDYVNNSVSVATGYLTGVHDLYVLAAPVTAGGGDIGNVNWFQFSLPASNTPAPSNLTATAGGTGQINLSWTNNASNADLVKVERSTDGVDFEQVAALPASSSSYTDSGLAGGATYVYRVRAFNSQGNTAYTNTASATTGSGTGVPAVPTGVTILANAANQLTVYWQNTSTIPMTGFSIDRATSSSFSGAQTFTASATASSYTDTGLTAGTTYYYRVRANGSAGASGNSATVSLSTVASVPSAPTNLVAVATSSQKVQLNWTDTSINETGFKVERSQDNGSTWSTVTTTAMGATQYIDSGLTPATAYQYRVSAVNGNGASATTSVAAVTTRSTQVAANHNFAAASYDDVSTTHGIPSVTISGSGVTGLAQNNWLLFRDLDFGSTSLAYFAANVAATDSGKQIEVHLDDRLGPVVATLNVTTTSSLTSYSLESTALSNVTGIHDIYLVSANVGTINLASFSFVNSLTSIPPAAPTNVVAGAVAGSTTSIQITWTNNATNQTGFRIERNSDPNEAATAWVVDGTAAANATSYTSTGLTSGTTYSFRVFATNVAGDSASSENTSMRTYRATTRIAHTTDTNISAPAYQTQNGGVHNWIYGLASLDDGDWVMYSDVNLTNARSFIVHMQSPNANRNIEVHLDSPTGTLIGNLTTTATGADWNAPYQEETVGLSGNPGGTHDVYIVFRVSTGVANVDYFRFSSALAPGTWTSKDIGAVGVAGSTSVSNGVYTVKGSGTDIWGTSDQFQYYYQSLNGDGQIIARVTGVQGTDVWAKAGVMIRETLNVDSTFADMLISSSNGAAFQYRSTTAAFANYTAGPYVNAPYWVKLVRTGNTFTGYISSDGVIWTQVGSMTITMATNVYIGLAVTAHNNTLLNTSTFDNVSVGAVTAKFWSGQDIGSVGQTGSASASSGVYTVKGSGADIWGTSDAFQYVYQPLSGDGTIVARVTAVQNTNVWAKAGVMIRESLNANSTYADMILTPGNGTNFQSRASTGGSCTYTGGPAATAPYWVKLVRSGNTFTGYASSDGTTWTQVSSTTITMATNVYIGLVVTAHDSSQLNTSTFDNVTLS